MWVFSGFSKKPQKHSFFEKTRKAVEFQATEFQYFQKFSQKNSKMVIPRFLGRVLRKWGNDQKWGIWSFSRNPFLGRYPPKKWKNGPKSIFFKKWPFFPNPRDLPKSSKIDVFGGSIQKWVFGQKSTFLEGPSKSSKPSIFDDFWQKCRKTPCLCPSYVCIFENQKSKKVEKTAFFGILLPVLCLFSPEHLLFGPFYIQKNDSEICTLFWNPILWEKEKWHFSMLSKVKKPSIFDDFGDPVDFRKTGHFDPFFWTPPKPPKPSILVDFGGPEGFDPISENPPNPHFWLKNPKTLIFGSNPYFWPNSHFGSKTSFCVKSTYFVEFPIKTHFCVKSTYFVEFPINPVKPYKISFLCQIDVFRGIPYKSYKTL